MKKLNQTLAVFTVTALLTGASTAWALQDPFPEPAPQQAPAPQEDDQQTRAATGELVSVDTDAMTITLKSADNQDWTFRYTAQTEIVGAQDGVSGLATKAGSNVTVYFTGEDDARTATKIEVAE